MKHLLLGFCLVGAGLVTWAQAPEPAWAPNTDAPFAETRPIAWDLKHTSLDIRLDLAKRHVLGNAELTLSPWFYAQDSVILDAVGFIVHNVALKSGSGTTPLQYSNTGRHLRIGLPSRIAKGTEVVLAIEYTARPDENDGKQNAVAGDKGFFFIDPDGTDPDRPTQVYTQGEVQANSRWFPTFDQPNVRCTQALTATVPGSWVTLSNGVMTRSVKNADGTRTDYWEQTLPHAPYLFAFIAGEFAVVKDTWRGKDVLYYVEPEFERVARGIFPHTPEMLEFFSTRLGVDFPWAKYGQVIVRDYQAGAMENTTAVTFQEGFQRDARALVDGSGELVVAHELFHHWFGDLVTCESWSNLPLNESFANYSEYLWYEYKYGKAEADRHYDEERRGYLGEAQRKREPLIRYHVADPDEMFDAHSYNKGGRVLHMLRNEVGDEAFFAGLKLYLERNKFSAVEIDELRIAMEDVTGRDLMWFFDQWFLKAGHAELEVSYGAPTAAGIPITVRQTQDTRYQPVYRLPLRVHVRAGGQDLLFPIVVTDSVQEFTVPFTAGGAEFADLDPEHYLLGTLTETGKTTAQFIAQYAQGAFYLQRQRALNELGKQATAGSLDAAQKQALYTALVAKLDAPFWGDRADALNFLTEHYSQDKLLVSAHAKLIGMVTTDKKPQVRRLALPLLAKQTLASKDKKAYTAAVATALTDSSYTVSGEALVAKAKLDPKAAETQATAWLTDPKGQQKGYGARTLLEVGSPTATAAVENYVETAGADFGVFNFLNETYGPYVKTATAEKQAAGIAFLQKVAKNGALSIYHRAGAVYALMENVGDVAGVKDFVKQLRDSETDRRFKGFLMNQFGDL